MATITYGKHTYGEITTVGGSGEKIIVGKYCSIASDVKVFMGTDHNIDLISTYPLYHSGRPISKLITTKAGPNTQHYNKIHKLTAIIGNDVWLGFGAIIFRDVIIGDGVVVGAFTKITKNIPPYSIVVGNSRIIRKRFSDEDVEFLLKLKWWDFPDQEVADIAPILHNPDIELLKQWAKEHGKI